MFPPHLFLFTLEQPLLVPCHSQPPLMYKRTPVRRAPPQPTVEPRSGWPPGQSACFNHRARVQPLPQLPKPKTLACKLGNPKVNWMIFMVISQSQTRTRVECGSPSIAFMITVVCHRSYSLLSYQQQAKRPVDCHRRNPGATLKPAYE